MWLDEDETHASDDQEACGRARSRRAFRRCRTVRGPPRRCRASCGAGPRSRVTGTATFRCKQDYRVVVDASLPGGEVRQTEVAETPVGRRGASAVGGFALGGGSEDSWVVDKAPATSVSFPGGGVRGGGSMGMWSVRTAFGALALVAALVVPLSRDLVRRQRVGFRGEGQHKPRPGVGQLCVCRGMLAERSYRSAVSCEAPIRCLRGLAGTLAAP